ncbi:unnamed protein product [Symbiodinium microadriaticum]|nr:unnamed protein product [Symbiodinium microadriaticum]
MYVRQLLLLALLTSDSARAAVSVPSEYNSSYTSMTVTTERYACSGELTGTRDSTQVGSVVLGSDLCSERSSFFECSLNGSKIGHFDCSSNALIEEFSVGSCLRCDHYNFSCDKIWWKGTLYDTRYFKPVCRAPSTGNFDSGCYSSLKLRSSFVLVFASVLLSC